MSTTRVSAKQSEALHYYVRFRRASDRSVLPGATGSCRQFAYMQNNSITIRIDNAIEQIGLVADAVDLAGRELHLSRRTVNEMNVVLDELLGNIIRHGYADDARHDIRVELSFAGNLLCATVEDDGIPFDSASPVPRLPDRKATAATIGGLGRHFVHALMDSVAYVRVGNINRVTVCRRDLPEQPAPASSLRPGHRKN